MFFIFAMLTVMNLSHLINKDIFFEKSKIYFFNRIILHKYKLCIGLELKLFQFRKRNLFWGYSKWQLITHKEVCHQIFGGSEEQTMKILQKNV